MRQSQLFTKTRFETPKDEVSKNANLLIRAGFIHKEMAGVYDYLPLGLRVIENLRTIIREEMNSVGGQEVSLSTLQSREIWDKTNRWSDDVVDNWFKTKLKNDTELGLGFSHEEPLSNLLRDHIRSYKDLPFSVYQIQTKFRNEARAKSGILRGREFLMKDLYTFSRSEVEHEEIYERLKQSYVRIFQRAGIGERTFVTFASGGTFSKYSHEFQTLTPAGEDTIYVSKEKNIAINREVYTDEVIASLGLNKADLKEEKAIEVGNIFSLGTKFSSAMELIFADEKGESKHPIMGCYGIGLGRLMGTIVEVAGSEDSMVWPEEVAPFKLHLIDLSQGDQAVGDAAQSFYDKLGASGIEVLLDDRDLRAGEKFADADLIGIPHRIVMSKRTEAAGTVEYTNRLSGETSQKSKEKIIDLIS